MPFSDSVMTKNKIVNVVVLIVLCLAAAQAYRYQLGEMNKLKEQQNEERRKNNLRENIAGMETRLEVYKTILRERDTSTVMNTLSSLAQEAGLKIESVRPGNEQKYQQYRKIPFVMKVKAAGYHSIGSFISLVESHSDVYIIESMTVNKSQLKQEVEADIILSTVSLVD